MYACHFLDSDDRPLTLSMLAGCVRSRTLEPAAMQTDHQETYWGAVAQFQAATSWTVRSDAVLDPAVVAGTYAGMAIGRSGLCRLAFSELGDALVGTYPHLATASRAELYQLIALGRDMANAVGGSPDLFDYVKNELQPVDLVELL